MRTAHRNPRPDREPEPATTAPPTAAPAAVAPPPRRRREDLVKFTATLEPEVVDRFERVTTAMRSVGRVAYGRYPSRADVLRSVLALVEEDPALMDRVRTRVAEDAAGRHDGTTD